MFTGQKKYIQVETTFMSDSIYDRQMKWKRHGERRLAFESQRLDMEKHEECTFTPQTNKHDVKRLNESGKLSAKSEAHAMRTHIARQQRARVNSEDSIKKQIYASAGKNFEVVTECKPFLLSKSNKTRRESIPLPKQRAHSESPKKTAPEIPVTTELDKQVRDLIDHKTDGSPWEQERASLISIIEAQRNEIKAREKAQQEATKVADKFATAILAFEERLVAIEQKAKTETTEMRKAMERQQVNIQLIMQAMGIQLDDGKVHETRTPRQLLFRKEYEKSNV